MTVPVMLLVSPEPDEVPVTTVMAVQARKAYMSPLPTCFSRSNHSWTTNVSVNCQRARRAKLAATAQRRTLPAPVPASWASAPVWSAEPE